MNGKTPNKEESVWLRQIRDLGCIVCMAYYRIEGSPAEVHHIHGGSHHLESIPLCDRHHRNPGDGYATRHGNESEFRARYGSDEYLLRLTREKLGYL